ncbi:MAG: hypothetical protein QME51_04575 [Planctomycetota bacterium]|nr:hypothetical protein [Planctomycetota bacterium]
MSQAAGMAGNPSLCSRPSGRGSPTRPEPTGRDGGGISVTPNGASISGAVPSGTNSGAVGVIKIALIKSYGS